MNKTTTTSSELQLQNWVKLMQRLLLRRTFRELQANLFRYGSFFLLVMLSMFIVTGLVGAAESVINSVDTSAKINHLEDGEFSLFVPLSNSQIDELNQMGVKLEEVFTLDFQMSDNSILRVMKNRDKINLVNLVSGQIAKAEDEIVLERIYAAAHHYAIGDIIRIAGSNFKISGFATTPDYELCIQNMSDMSADGNNFGTAFVSDTAYERLRDSNALQHGEEYNYSYILNSTLSDMELKDKLKEFKIETLEVKDPFFQEMVKNKSKDRDELIHGLQMLNEGSTQINDGTNELMDGSLELSKGIKAIRDGLDQLSIQSPELVNASAQMKSALDALSASLQTISFNTNSINQLQAYSNRLLNGLHELNRNLLQLSSEVNYNQFNVLLKSNGFNEASLSAESKLLLSAFKNYLDQVNSYLIQSADGSSVLYEQFQYFNEAIGQLSNQLFDMHDSMLQLSSAVELISDQYKQLDHGIENYTDAVWEIRTSYTQIVNGIETLRYGTAELANGSKNFHLGIVSMQEKSEDIIEDNFALEIENLISFVRAADNPRIKAANDDVKININVGIMTGIILLVLITYVISVFIIHSIDRESSMIGALYALGLKRNQLLLHYTMLPVALCLIGGLFGTLAGYSSFGISIMANSSYTYFSIPEIQSSYNPYLLIYGIVLPPLIAYIVNRLIIFSALSRPALSLLRKESVRKSEHNKVIKGLDFEYTFMLRQFIREKRSSLALLAGMFVSLLVLILGLNCLALCLNIRQNNRNDAMFKNMYQYKYPTEEVPKHGYEAYLVSLNKEVMGYDMEVSLYGITNDNPYLPSIISTRKNEISVSTSMAEKYNLKIGDKLILSDEVNEKEYSFMIKEIVPYSIGLSCFMDLDSLRDLFEMDEDAYNIVYAGQDLEVDAGRLYGITTKEDVEKSSDIFMQIMIPMMILLIFTSTLIFMIVMVQMMKVMLERSAFSISLMKIFGYKNKEIRKLYLDGSFILIAVSSLILIPTAKYLLDMIYPLFIANIACGIDLSWPIGFYMLVYLGILCCYLIIRSILMTRINKATPTEVLKERE